MPTPVSRERLSLAVLSVGAFATVVSGTMLSPLLRPIAAEFGVSEATAGQVVTPASLVAVLAALAAMPWMDRVSLRTWLRAQSALVAVATVATALAPGFGWLMLGRVLAGLGGAVILANCLAGAGALYADPARRNRALGVIVSATTVAIVVGLPALAQIEAAAGWRWAAGSLVVPLSLLFAGSWWLPNAPARPRVDTSQGARACYRRVLGHGEAVWLLAMLAVIIGVYVGWLTYFGAYVAVDFGAGAGVLSALFLVAGAAEMVANNATPPLLRRVSPRRILAVATLVFAANLLLTDVVSTSLWSVFVATSITSVCAAVLYIAANALLLDSLPTERGAVMALGSASIGIGAALGALVGGVALATLGSYAGAYRVLGLTLVLAVGCLALSNRRRAGVPAGAHPIVAEEGATLAS